MKKKFLAIDPGTKTGYTLGALLPTLNKIKIYEVGEWNNAAKKATKKRQAEPKHFRLKHLWDNICNVNYDNSVEAIICEGAAGFMRGKAAVEASHKFRAVIQLYCALNDVQYIEITPADLKFYATGKRTAEKNEMIKQAQKLGYEGHNDNEADSFLILKWYVETHHEK